MPLTLPFTIGPRIDSAPLNADFQAIADKFNAGLTGADFAANANVPGTALALASLPANRIVASDITAAQIALATITADRLVALCVDASHLAANAVLAGKVKIITGTDYVLSGTVNSANSGVSSTAVTTAMGQPVGLCVLVAGVPNTTALGIAPALFLNQGTSTYYLGYTCNPSLPTISSLVGITLRAYFVAAS